MAATNRVKGAPSTMGAGRAEIGEEAFEHKAAAEECGINKSRMKTKAIIPAVLTRALTVVYLGEKQMNLSPFPSSLLQHFEFDVKVKKETDPDLVDGLQGNVLRVEAEECRDL